MRSRAAPATGRYGSPFGLKVNARPCRPRFHCASPAACPPCDGTQQHSDDMLGHIPDNAPSDVLRTRRRRLRIFLRKAGTSHAQTRCHAPYNWPSADIFACNPYPMRYNAPSSLRPAPANTRWRSGRTRQRIHCKLRYMFHPVGVTFQSPICISPCLQYSLSAIRI